MGWEDAKPWIRLQGKQVVKWQISSMKLNRLFLQYDIVYRFNHKHLHFNLPEKLEKYERDRPTHKVLRRLRR